MKLLDIPLLKGIIVDRSATLSLDTALQNARAEWQQALKEMDYIDDDLVDYVIFKINAAEKRYVALLEQAKKEQFVAWGYLDLACSPGEETSEGLCNTGAGNAPA
ncbi:MAG: DUF2508 family protein [Pelotomaculum sp.]|jgi:hypothetical protein